MKFFIMLILLAASISVILPIEYVLTIFIILTLVAAAFLFVSWIIARLWCTPKRRELLRTPANLNLPFEQIVFQSHGVKLSGWFIPAASGAAPFPVVILAHGWSSHSADLLLSARFLNEAGYAVLMYDARGHGASGKGGPITIRKFAEDILSSVRYLKGRSDIDLKRLGVFGFSMGGAASILAASVEQRIKAVVSCSAFSDPKTITDEYLQKLHLRFWPIRPLVVRIIEHWLGAGMADVAPRNRVSLLKTNLLIMHGDADKYVSPKNAEVLYSRSVRDRTNLVLIPKRDHFDVLRDAECREEVISFFNKHLLSPQNLFDEIECNTYEETFLNQAIPSKVICCG